MGSPARDPTTLFIDACTLSPDLATVDALARLALVARRHHCRPVLWRAGQELSELIELAGLSDVLPVDPPTPRSTAPRC
jgi:hypothetical protein